MVGGTERDREGTEREREREREREKETIRKGNSTTGVKRDLLQCQKRPTTVSKETYYSVKRDLLQSLM
jgi:hypothetical protein